VAPASGEGSVSGPKSTRYRVSAAERQRRALARAQGRLERAEARLATSLSTNTQIVPYGNIRYFYPGPNGMVRVRLNRAHHPVTTLGPGSRIALWFQGCGIGGPGRVSRDTWAPDPAAEMGVPALLEWCAARPLSEVDGVTISGGEPFDQPDALAAVLAGLDRWRREVGREIDLLCYSGRTLPVLRRRFPAVLARLDAVIAGPYLDGGPTERPWRGSDDQPLVPLTALGRRRYADLPEPGRPRLQLAVDDGSIWCIGIPRAGDLDRAETSLAERGVLLEDVSWRP
jgi:anaerobic ribonucleoside-triphosphate reductase activating protein